jgi:hypothetical protein
MYVFCLGDDQSADISTGENKLYGVKLAWQHLSWRHCPRAVELQHHKGGPIITMECRWFDTNSLDETDRDETNLYWKAKEGWRAIKTTSFGLEDAMKDMDDYISRCSTFYLQGDHEDLGYIGNMLEAVESHVQVFETPQLKSPLNYKTDRLCSG